MIGEEQRIVGRYHIVVFGVRPTAFEFITRITPRGAISRGKQGIDIVIGSSEVPLRCDKIEPAIRPEFYRNNRFVGKYLLPGSATV